ncbi:MAG: hypothetical protein OEQ53_17400, partial [Saprospiraceae bacterium]|nr:hypothetical protein [Saprospiraceae bacterium]
MKQLKRIAISLFLASFAFSLSSQDSKEIFAAMYEEERESIEALVLYPGETRVAILEVSVYPELLVRVSAIQEASKDRFAGILSNLNREDQETIWDLTRYPGLVKMLVALKTDHRDIDACLE